MLVVPASSSVVALDVSAPERGDKRGENWSLGPGSGCCCHFSPMVASENGNVEVVDKLLQHRATIHIQDRVINNPIMSEFW